MGTGSSASAAARAAEAWVGDLILALEQDETTYFAALLARHCPLPKSTAGAWACLVTETLAADLAGSHWWIQALPEPIPAAADPLPDHGSTDGPRTVLLRILGREPVPLLRLITLRPDSATRHGYVIDDIVFVETGQNARRLFLASAPDAALPVAPARWRIPRPHPLLVVLLAVVAGVVGRIRSLEARGRPSAPGPPPHRRRRGTPRRAALAAAALLGAIAWSLMRQSHTLHPTDESPHTFRAVAAAIAALDQDRPEAAVDALAGSAGSRLPEVAVFRAIARTRQGNPEAARRELRCLPDGMTRAYQLAQLDREADPLGAADSLAELANRVGGDAALAETAASLLLKHGHSTAALRVLERSPPRPGDPASALWRIAYAAALATLPGRDVARVAEIAHQLELAMADLAWTEHGGRPLPVSPRPRELRARWNSEPSGILPLIEAVTGEAAEAEGGLAPDALAAQLATRLGPSHPLAVEWQGRAALRRGVPPAPPAQAELLALPPLTAHRILLRYLDSCSEPKLQGVILTSAAAAHPASWPLIDRSLALDPGTRRAIWWGALENAPAPLRQLLLLLLASAGDSPAESPPSGLPTPPPAGMTLYELAAAEVPWLPPVALDRGLTDLLERRLILTAAEVIQRARQQPYGQTAPLTAATGPTPARHAEELADKLTDLIATPNVPPPDPGVACPATIDGIARAAVEQAGTMRALGGLLHVEGLACITHLDLGRAPARLTRRWIVVAGSDLGAFQLREWSMPLASCRQGGWIRATIWSPGGEAMPVEQAVQVRVRASRYGPPAVALLLPPISPLSILDIAWEELLDPTLPPQEVEQGLWPLPHVWPCRRHLLAVQLPTGPAEFGLVALSGGLPRIEPAAEAGLWLVDEAGPDATPCLWRIGQPGLACPDCIGRRQADFIESSRVTSLPPAADDAAHSIDSIIAGLASRSHVWPAHPWEPFLAQPRHLGESLASLGVSAEERLRIAATFLQAAGTRVQWWVRCRDLPELRMTSRAAATGIGQFEVASTITLPDPEGPLPFLVQIGRHKWIDAGLQSLDDLPEVRSGARWRPVTAVEQPR